jgi:hypothetical protein
MRGREGRVGGLEEKERAEEVKKEGRGALPPHYF